jgi:hypothetical protein
VSGLPSTNDRPGRSRVVSVMRAGISLLAHKVRLDSEALGDSSALISAPHLISNHPVNILG